VLLSADAQAQQPVVKSAAAATASTISAGIQIQNLSTTTTANVTVNYYNPDGTAPSVPSQSFTINANSSYTLFGPTLLAPAGFSGSAVVSSDQPVVAITNLLGASPTIGDAYDGVSATGAATTANVPLFLQGIGSPANNSTLYVQNASTTAQSVKITFTNTAGTVVASPTFSLNASGSVTVNSSNDGITGTFVGSAVVASQSSLPVAVVAAQSNGANLVMQTGSGSGNPTVYVPLLMNNNGGDKALNTGLQVQNVGTQTTTATLTIFYSDGTSQVISPQPNLTAGQSFTWFPISSMTHAVGSGVITSNNGQNLLAIVNELDSVTGQATGYNGFSGGTQTINMPLVMFNNGGNYTGEQVQNVGTCAATVTLSVTDNKSGQVALYQQLLQPKASYTWFSATSDIIPASGKVGAATATSPSSCAPIVGIVNEITSPQVTGDTTFAYDGFNQ